RRLGKVATLVACRRTVAPQPNDNWLWIIQTPYTKNTWSASEKIGTRLLRRKLHRLVLPLFQFLQERQLSKQQGLREQTRGKRDTSPPPDPCTRIGMFHVERPRRRIPGRALPVSLHGDRRSACLLAPYTT